jgi:GWxTD domain-containing protein
MLFAVCLLLWALPVRGDLKVALEPAVYPAPDGSDRLELSYEIPFRSLAFTREDGRFVARFELAVEGLDRGGELVAADVWRRLRKVADYDATGADDSAAVGTVELPLPAAAASARIRVSDGSSERRAVAEFRIDRPAGGMVLRLRQRQPRYAPGDTVQAEAEVVGPQARPLDSCRFRVLADGRVVAGGTEPALDSQGRRVALYRLAIADTGAEPRLASGDYRLEAVSGQARASVTFRVEVPFYLDDRAWQRRVEQLLYVADIAGMRRLAATPRPERKQAWRDFWGGLDQSPTTSQSEREEEYFERIAYCEEHFGHGDRGFRADRARVYVRFGPPDQIESRPFEIDAPARETWHYYEPNRQFVFVDRFGSGEFVLQNPEALDGR